MITLLDFGKQLNFQLSSSLDDQGVRDKCRRGHGMFLPEGHMISFHWPPVPRLFRPLLLSPFRILRSWGRRATQQLRAIPERLQDGTRALLPAPMRDSSQPPVPSTPAHPTSSSGLHRQRHSCARTREHTHTNKIIKKLFLTSLS